MALFEGALTEQVINLKMNFFKGLQSSCKMLENFSVSFVIILFIINP